jgi:hypothetical protein
MKIIYDNFKRFAKCDVIQIIFSDAKLYHQASVKLVNYSNLF